VWRQYHQRSAAGPLSHHRTNLIPNDFANTEFPDSGGGWHVIRIAKSVHRHLSPLSFASRRIHVSSTLSNTATFLAFPQASNAKCEESVRREGASNDCFSCRLVKDGGFGFDGDRISFLGVILKAEQIAAWGSFNRSFNRVYIRSSTMSLGRTDANGMCSLSVFI
jgi:hypothetical protein